MLRVDIVVVGIRVGLAGRNMISLHFHFRQADFELRTAVLGGTVAVVRAYRCGTALGAHRAAGNVMTRKGRIAALTQGRFGLPDQVADAADAKHDVRIYIRRFYLQNNEMYVLVKKAKFLGSVNCSVCVFSHLVHSESAKNKL